MSSDRPPPRRMTRRFPAFRYMRWAKAHIPTTNDSDSACYLAGSGLPPPTAEELPLDPAGVSLDHAGYDMPPRARRRLAERWGVPPEQLLLTLGTSHGLHLICASALSSGDRCLVERPAYEMLVNLPGLFGASVDRFERRFEEGWGLPQDLPDRIRRDRPAMVLMSNPHNPSGVVVEPAVLDPVLEAVAEVDGLLVVDEVYLEYLDDPVAGSALGLVGHGHGGRADHLAVASSFTKAYGLGTVRFGWLITSESRIEAALKYNDYISVLYPNPGAWVGLAAMDRLEALGERARRIQDRGRAIVERWIEGRDDVDWVAPNAGVVGFLKLANVSETDVFAERLERDQDTVVVPGEFFGAPGFLRLGFGGEPDELREGLRRLGVALDVEAWR